MNKLGRMEDGITSVLDNASRLQGPAVQAYVRRLRRQHPSESPAQIIERLEKRYLLAVTGSGSAAGATAAIPGVGTGAALAAIGGETAFFLEASALLALSFAAVHGIPLDDRERRRGLVLAVALGESGMEVVERTVGVRGVRDLMSKRIPGNAIAGMNTSLLAKFIKRFLAKRSALILGKLLPAGIGAVIGGAGNRTIGRGVVRNSREAFGPPPVAWPSGASAELTDGRAGPAAVELTAGDGRSLPTGTGTTPSLPTGTSDRT